MTWKIGQRRSSTGGSSQTTVRRRFSSALAVLMSLLAESSVACPCSLNVCMCYLRLVSAAMNAVHEPGSGSSTQLQPCAHTYIGKAPPPSNVFSNDMQLPVRKTTSSPCRIADGGTQRDGQR